MNKCPYCGAEHIHKSGKLLSGKQRWICNVCKKGFSTGTDIVRTVKNTVEEKCPYCGGELRTRGWNTSGSRRYRCKDCGKSCSSSNGKIEAKITDNPPCVYCGSTHTRKGGTLKDGTKRYTCSECGKGFSAKTVVKDPVKLRCPKCNGESRRSGKQENGKQRYICKSCGHKFVENPTQSYDRYTKHEKECPKCGHNWAKKAGKSAGKQYYRCLSCGHKYLEGGCFKRGLNENEKQQIKQLFRLGASIKTMEKQIGRSIKTISKNLNKIVNKQDKTARTKFINQKIRELILNGNHITDVSFKFNVTSNYINKIMQKHYKLEHISPQQYEDIIKFGVCCNVPIKWLAPYIKCSEHKCQQIISQYPTKQAPKYKISAQEKAQDKMCLDKFIG